MRPLSLASLLLASLILMPLADAAPGSNRGRDDSGVIRSGSTRYYDWQLNLLGSRVPTPTPGTIQQPVARPIESGLDARRHFLAVDSWGAAGDLRFLNSAVPVDVRWASGEAWASDRERFNNLILVTVDGTAGAATRPYVLQADSRLTISPGTRALYAFFPDIGPLSDNRGAVNLTLSDRSGRSLTLRVDARAHAISMEQTNALALEVTPGVANTITARRGESRDNFRQALLGYALLTTTTAQGRQSLIVNTTERQPLTFWPTVREARLTWVGFEDVTRGAGTTTFELSAAQAVRGMALPQSVWEDQWGTQQPWDDSRWNWERDDWGSPMTYELRLSNLQAGAQYTPLLPFALHGLRAGDQVVITGQLPREVRAGTIRLYAADDDDDDRRVRATLAVGSLAVTAESRDNIADREWRYFTANDEHGDLLLAAGSASNRSVIPAGTTFRLTIDVAPYRNERRGEPFDLYAGLALAANGDQARTIAERSWGAADAINHITLGSGFGLRGEEWDDDDDDRDRSRNRNRGRGGWWQD